MRSLSVGGYDFPVSTRKCVSRAPTHFLLWNQSATCADRGADRRTTRVEARGVPGSWPFVQRERRDAVDRRGRGWTALPGL